MVVVLSTDPELTAVPPVTQLSVALGPHRKKDRVPLQVAAPPTVRLPESLTETEPVPIDRPPPGIEPPLLSLAVVVSPEVQLPKFPSTKLLRVALVEVDDRLSASELAKHSVARPGNSERLMPPS